MMSTTCRARAMATLMAALIVGCGGGITDDAPQQPTQAVAAMRAHALAVTSGEISSDAAAEQLMDFAEAGPYAEHFPGHPVTQSWSVFQFRRYANGVYLGVVTRPGSGYQLGGVYVMGGEFGAEPSLAGPLTAFVQPNNYAPGSDEATLFRALTAARANAGAVQQLTQDTTLDRAARAHASYLAANSAWAHTEEQGRPGFTGVWAQDRAAAAGFLTDSGVGEVIAGSEPTQTFADSLLHSVYHRSAVLAGDARLLGVGTAAAPWGRICVLNMARPMGAAMEPLLQPQGQGVSWPPADAINVPTSFAPWMESPNPVPARTTDQGPVGYPVSVLLSWRDAPLRDDAYTVKRFELRDEAGALVPAIVMARAGTLAGPGVALEVGGGGWVLGEYFLIARQPLRPGERYTVSFEAVAGSIGYSRAWSFTTAR